MQWLMYGQIGGLIMTDYIDRKAFLEHMKKTNRYFTVKFDIEEFPAADVAPVVHTRWAHLGGDEWCCPVCGFIITTEGSWDKPTKKYCEDCGAKMDAGVAEDAREVE